MVLVLGLWCRARVFGLGLGCYKGCGARVIAPKTDAQDTPQIRQIAPGTIKSAAAPPGAMRN